MTPEPVFQSLQVNQIIYNITPSENGLELTATGEQETLRNHTKSWEVGNEPSK